jgi:DNA uptake protein ComE-like DNA-binding protein
MGKNIIYEYINFTKKERRGIALLVIIVMALAIAPYIWQNAAKVKPSPIDSYTKAMLDSISIKVDTNRTVNSRRQDYFMDPSRFRDYSPYVKNNERSIQGELFYFDPNTLSEAGWVKLGVSQKAAANIIKYREKGGQFSTADDLDKMYSLSDDMVERLIPYVSIQRKDNLAKTNFVKNSGDRPVGSQAKVANAAFNNTVKADNLIDINTADTTTFKTLPGIGSKLSARIVNFRDKLGGFLSVDQVGETFGLQDSTYQKIKPMLVCNAALVKKININTATVEQLKHPYLRYHQARNMVEYRNQHGAYKTLAELRNLATISDTELTKILPYLMIE